MNNENLKKLIVITIIALLSTSFIFTLVLSAFYFFRVDNISLRKFLVLLFAIFLEAVISCIYLSFICKEDK